MLNVETSSRPRVRLNVLLTEDRPHAPEHWTRQLPRLLEPQGVASYTARTGREAVDLAERHEIHAAVIDLGTPVGSLGAAAERAALRDSGAAGLWLLELFRRLPRRPPIVVVNSPALSERQLQRLLSESLRLGVFSVVNKPVYLEQLLVVLRRLIERQYRGAWPGAGEPPAASDDEAGPS